MTIFLKGTVLFLCLYFMQFFNFPNILLLAVGGLLCLVMVIQQKKLRIDIGILLLSYTMMIHYMILFGKRAVFTMIPYIPLVIYVIANYLMNYIKKSRECNEGIFRLVACLLIGYTVHGILNMYMYLAGYRVEGTRRWMDVWTKTIEPGTQHGIYFLPALAMLLPAILYFKKRKISNILVILAAGFFCYASLITKSRMQLLILAIIFMAQLVLYMILERELFIKQIKSKQFKFMAVSGIVVLICLIAIFKDNDIIVAFINNMGKDGGILNNARFVAQRKALSQLFLYPTGGRKMDTGMNYLHNVWLDMANATGTYSFLGFVAYTAFTVVELVRFVLKKEIVTDIKLMITGLYGAFFLYFTVEPALDASIHFITPWIFLNGLVHGYISKEYKK